MKTANGATILLTSGSYFDFDDPWHSDFTIDDIATGLSRTCRFGGHCRDFYSVAEHAVYVSMLVPEEDAKAGLHHDDPEAFITDMAGPLKPKLPDYLRYERDIESAVLHRFGIEYLPRSVKIADMIMLATEKQQIMSRPNDYWPCLDGIEPVQSIQIKCMTPGEARDFYLERYYELENS